MRESVRNFAIGVVSIVGLVGFGALLVSFGELTSLFERRYVIDIALNEAGGLREGSLVTLHGVPVGLIDGVSIANDDPMHPVRVRALIDNQVLVPDPATPAVESSLLGSGARLELDGEGKASGRSFAAGKVPLLVGEYRPLDEKFIAALDERLDQVRNELSGSLRSFDEFASTFTTLGRNVNDLVKPIGPGDDPEGSLRTTVARMNHALNSADEALALARTWLGDEALRADVKGAVSKANDLIARAADAISVITGLASNLDADRARLVRGLVGVFDEASAALGDVRRILALAATGDGTIAKLLNDADLYDNLADSAKRLQKAMEAIQAVAEKLRAEGIKIEF
jgi:phospholipid/cholesterol/gamma-HCH transport system substrate-binding protein